jgi:hypothetical protein
MIDRMRAALIVLTVLELGVLLTVQAPRDADKPGIAGGIRTAAAQLRGDAPPVDLVQDYAGGRALVEDREPYPVLSQAFAEAGIAWPAEHRSTHPPTAFVLALPVAWLPFGAAAAAWAALMLAAIAASWWAFGCRWELAAALGPLTLLWPPAAWSLGQLTPIWLLGLALAWRFRERADVAGAAVALASLTKLLPALSIVPFVVLGHWRALRGFTTAWAGALAVIVLLHPGALARYVDIARATGDDQAGRGENAALLWAAGHNFGLVGVAAAALLVAAVPAVSIRRLRSLRRVERNSFDAWSFAGVALLPIAWIYSLLPLLPAIARALWTGRPLARALAAVCLVMPFLIDPFGLPGAIRLAGGTACLGLALLADELPAVRRS